MSPYFRATTEDLGSNTEIKNGETHEHVNPEEGPLFQSYIDGELYIRPETEPTVCFSDSIAGALLGALTAREKSGTYHIYKTTKEPDIDLRSTPKTIENAVTISNEEIAYIELDYDIIGEVRYKNPSDDPISIQKYKTVNIPLSIVESVQDSYGNNTCRDELQDSLEELRRISN